MSNEVPYVHILTDVVPKATSRQLQRLTMSSKTPMYASFTTTLTGLVTIRAFQSERHFKQLSMYHLDRAQAPMYYRYAGIRFLQVPLSDPV